MVEAKLNLSYFELATYSTQKKIQHIAYMLFQLQNKQQ